MVRRLIALAAAVFALNAFAAVDANRASQAELESVKGIGPGLSTKILQARQAGAFKDWGDFVDRVAGVGPGNAARFSQAGLTVGEQAYASKPAGAADSPPRTDRRSSRKAAEPAAR